MGSPATTTATSPSGKLRLSSEKGREIVGVVLAAAVVLLGLSLASHDPGDPSVLSHVGAGGDATQNLIGPIGAQVSALAFALLGLCALLVPIALTPIAWRLLRGKQPMPLKGRRLGIVLLAAALPTTLQLLVGEIGWRGVQIQSGGTVGVLLRDALVSWLHFGGAFVVLATALAAGTSLAVHTTLRDTADTAREHALGWWEALEARLKSRRRDQELTRGRSPSSKSKWGRKVPVETAADEVSAPTLRAPRVERPSKPTPAESPEPTDDEPLEENEAALTMAELRVTQRSGEGQFAIRRVRGSSAPEAEVMPPPPSPVRVKTPRRPEAMPPETAGVGEPTPEPRRPPRPKPRLTKPPPSRAEEPLPSPASQHDEPPPPDISADQLPPINLLSTEPTEHAHDETELLELGEQLRTSCEQFGVQGTVEAITPGPVITVFELQPAPGVKVSRVVGLQDDLALALKAESVRIDRIPGRSTLGVEVPNDSRSVIHLGYLLDNDEFRQAPSPLTMAMGVDLHGRPYFADLAKMPHLLVAGATGAGKSVGLQTMITSILYKATREQVKFIFIDPKRIELGVYADIPHLKAEVVVEPKKAANALRWAVSEMERRYRLLAEIHVRSIAYYNRAVLDPKERQRLALTGDGESEVRFDDLEPLPYYVIIIDELADLMMVSSSDVETSIARLAQMARAVGIHLIIATQRPSVDVLTGTIKANFPCRLAYATATRHDSRTILDQVGSEKLLGKGDALFIPPGSSRIVRLHGAYVSEKETAKLIRWLKRHGKPEIDPDVVKDPEGEGGATSGAADAANDPLFEEAARMVVLERQASASFLQRRMRVGFSRAARLIDMMEADGLLGPAQGSKPRDVLVPPDWFDEVDQAHGE